MAPRTSPISAASTFFYGPPDRRRRRPGRRQSQHPSPQSERRPQPAQASKAFAVRGTSYASSVEVGIPSTDPPSYRGHVRRKPILLALIVSAFFALNVPGASSGPPKLVAPVLSASVTGTEVSLTWTDAGGETSYHVMRLPPAAVTWTEIAPLRANTLQYKDWGLSPSTTYHYVVVATRGWKQMNSNAAQITTGVTPSLSPSSNPSPSPSLSPSPSPSPGLSPSPNPSPSPSLSTSPNPSPAPSPSPSPSPTSSACSGVINIYPMSGTYTMGAYPDYQGFDARSYVTTNYPFNSTTPVRIGEVNAGFNPCWKGGTFLGQQSRSLTWDQVKAIGGAAIKFVQSGNADINAWQVDNIEDGIDLRSKVPSSSTSGDGWTIRNAYMYYVRDDCIADDDMSSGAVFDVLFDGCFVGISTARDGSQPNQSGETIVINHALMFLQEQPADCAQFPDCLDSGHLLKWDPFAPRPVIRNSVFLIDQPSGAGEWPVNTTLSNVTIVLNGPGTLSLNMLPGMTVTTDMSVWNKAKADWLTRHGCSAFVPGVGASCTQQANPTPPA
jgi:hypothetical protein